MPNYPADPNYGWGADWQATRAAFMADPRNVGATHTNIQMPGQMAFAVGAPGDRSPGTAAGGTIGDLLNPQMAGLPPPPPGNNPWVQMPGQMSVAPGSPQDRSPSSPGMSLPLPGQGGVSGPVPSYGAPTFRPPSPSAPGLSGKMPPHVVSALSQFLQQQGISSDQIAAWFPQLVGY